MAVNAGKKKELNTKFFSCSAPSFINILKQNICFCTAIASSQSIRYFNTTTEYAGIVSVVPS